MLIRRQNIFMLEILFFWSFDAATFSCQQFPVNFLSDSLIGHEEREDESRYRKGWIAKEMQF